ncbi:MAG TPA: polysaccharide biosynthesis/export family protein [Candidatus Manganitrophaceae bacterium]|nr:polysaccharide biosynthesis/export family protein [Candidatus Manganitrophaceae bacterium]
MFWYRGFGTLFLALLFFSAVQVAPGQTATSGENEMRKGAEVEPRSEKATGKRADEYVLGPGDVIQVVVWRNEHLSKTLPVRPDGKISLPLVDDVQAAGMTPSQLKETISKGLRHFIDNPIVTVIVSEVNNFKVSVLGEVKKPGVYLLKGKTTVLEAISMAEGFTEFATTNNILLMKKAKGERLRFDYRSYIAGENMDQNVYLDPGDTIIVK